MTKKTRTQNTDFVEFVELQLDKMIEESYPKTSINIPTACDSFRPDKDTMQFIGDRYTALYEEVSSTESDYVEAYGHLSRPQRNNLLSFIGEVLVVKDYVPKEDEKVNRFRKPRRTREKTPAQLASKMLFAEKDEELSLSSLSPSKIVNSNGCILYNTKTTKMMLFIARRGLKLSVKGSKIMNFDVELSAIKNLRKPKEMLAGFETITIAKAKKLFTDIKAKPVAMNGSINKNCLIFRVF